MKKLFTCGLSLLAVFAVTACNKDKDAEDVKPAKNHVANAQGWYDNEKLSSEVEINVAVSDDQGFYITNHNAAAFVGLDGVTYQSGDLLPSWKYMEKRLNIKFNDTAKTGRDTSYSEHQAEGFANADIINTGLSTINEAGSNGTFLNLLGTDSDGIPYVNIDNPSNSYMPNFSLFLNKNKTLAKAMMVDGAIYTTSYFDGFAEPEHFFHMNLDMVMNVLDGELTNANTGAVGTISYKEFNKYTENASVDITVGLGKAAEAKKITKKNKGKNAMTEVKKAGTGKEMVENLRAHLNAVYDGQIGAGKTYEKLSDIFISESASYDTDELVALMYCIHNNNGLAQGVAQADSTKIDLFIARENKSNAMNQRAINVLQGLGIMYGVRGAMESKCNSAVYLDAQGNIRDGRADKAWMDMFDYSSKLYADGIIPADYASEASPIGKVKTNQAFMIHDYMNNSTNNKNTNSSKANFEAVLPPVYNWDDGDAATDYFQFSESNRSSCKTETWGVPARVADDKNKLTAVLTLMDYLYSIEGDMLMNYGPNAEQVALYGGTNVNAYCTTTKKSDWSDLRGCYIEHYTMSEQALTNMNNKDASATSPNPQNGAGWNKWSKQEMGSNLPIGFVREFFAEYETMSENGKSGYDRVSSAFKNTKTYKILTIGSENPFFECVPSLTLTGSAAIAAQNKTTITKTFSGNKNEPEHTKYVRFGWGDTTNETMTLDEYKQYVATELTAENDGLIKLYSDAYALIK